MQADGITGRSAGQIADSVRTLLARRTLRAGDALPTVRALAAALDVNRNTVAAAYSSLARAGIVETRRRGGTVVQDIAAVVGEGLTAGAHEVNLADGNPDPAMLPPLPSLSGHIARLYGAAPVDERLREWAARSVLPDVGRPGTLVLTHGAVDAVERVLSAHLTRGDAIAVEDPCFLSSIGTIRVNGYRSIPVPVDDEGMTPEGLRAALDGGARAVVCTPRAHNPTGASISAGRAAQLQALLEAHPEVLVIEDDHFSAVAKSPYRRVTPASTARWALVRSVSKFVGPDLRVAFTVCDADTAARVEARLSASAWVSHILQHLVAEVLAAPSSPALFERAAQQYQVRRSLLLDALGRRNIAPSRGGDGLNVWIPLLTEERPVVAELASRGWAVRPGSLFALTPRPAIRVTTATITPALAEAFASELAGVLART